MPNNKLLVRPNIVLVDGTKEPVEKEVLLVYETRYSNSYLPYNRAHQNKW